MAKRAEPNNFHADLVLIEIQKIEARVLDLDMLKRVHDDLHFIKPIEPLMLRILF